MDANVLSTLTFVHSVSLSDEENDEIHFRDKMAQYIVELREQMEEGQRLDGEIKKALKGIKFEV